MATIFLKHQYPNSIPEQAYYFYDGRTVVRYGVIELPAGNETWLRAAFMNGYRVHPDSGELLSLDQIIRMGESAQSAGVEVEGSDLGRQPAGEDGVRESELPRDAGVPASGVGSSRSPRAAKRTARN